MSDGAVLGVLALAAFAVAAPRLAPVVLTRGTWWLRRPRAALRIWLAAFALSAGSLTVSLTATVIVAAVSADPGGVRAFALCLVAWCGLGAAGCVAAVLTTTAEPIAATSRRTDVAMTLLAATSTVRVERVGGHEVVYVDVSDPIACSTRDGRILISTAVADAMPPSCVRAVIEHERAHVLGRHDFIGRVAALNAAAFPRLRTARTFRSTVAVLVELVADDAATRVCGPGTVRDTLSRMDRIDPDPSLALRAARLAAVPTSSWQHPWRRAPAVPTR